ncbi:uncharacterized protein ARMOST_02303 [Armillaria ostoyae]|uniref:Uncharacterized protein n=1 Tax=Armillaria ostoyae TaxID=47428 RepID=A0A284QRC4_ARMOS|nr:uncharacterized protein ARMOST_02303 [Armillaria ostoyae]
MCRRRHVRNVYLACGHTFNLPEEIVRQISFISAFAFTTLPRFDVRSLNASSVYSILLTADRRFVCVPAGNTFAIQSNIPPISAGIAPPVTGKRNTKDINKQ